MEPGISDSDFGKSELPNITRNLLFEAFRRASVRRGVKFQPIFNFQYKDGHTMISVGGMITTHSERKVLRGSTLDETIYYRPDAKQEPYTIRVPRLTRKERIHLDIGMPCDDPNWAPQGVVLQAEDIAAYREIYRFLPAFAELLV